MLTRAKVVEIDMINHPNQLKVRIPIFNGIPGDSLSYSRDSDLSWASIVAIPGINISYNVGDIVIVGFEDHNSARPIVLGYLQSAINSVDNKLYIDATEVRVSNNLVLPVSARIDYESVKQS